MEKLDSSGVLNPDNLADISRILEKSKGTCFKRWKIDKYMKVTEFVKKLRFAESKLIPAKDMITYETFTQESCSEYFNLVYSSFWGTEDSTK